MKPMTESPEVFEAYARIDFCKLALERISAELHKPRTPITMLVDLQTGYNPIKEAAKAARELAEEMIRSKKIIEADYSAEVRLLETLNTKFLQPC